jgi:hypothetical protein
MESDAAPYANHGRGTLNEELVPSHQKETPAMDSQARPLQLYQSDPVEGLNSDRPLPEGEMPVWNPEGRELWFRGKLVKQFHHKAGNQVLILEVFEELGWPPRIDDPLPPKSDQEPKERLRETMKSLNHGLDVPLLRFHADGTGRGIRWEAVE